MNVERHPWVAVANYGVGWEADLAVARLEAAGIPARATGNDHVGIFGPGYQGASIRGFDVQVPAPYAAHAKDVLARPPEPLDETFEDGVDVAESPIDQGAISREDGPSDSAPFERDDDEGDATDGSEDWRR